MKKARIIIMVISAMILIAFLVIFDYSNITARPNLGVLLGMLSAALNIFAMIYSIRNERKQQTFTKSERTHKARKP
jgi:F0F1-type ATP synthase assembly protein I